MINGLCTFDGLSLHLKIDRGVPVGRGDTGVAKPLADRDDVDAPLAGDVPRCYVDYVVRDIVQSVFSPPPRLATSRLHLNMIRRVAGLKTLCIMPSSR